MGWGTPSRLCTPASARPRLSLQHFRPKCYSVGSALLFRMLREGKMRSTFRNIQDSSFAAYTLSTAGPWPVPRRSTA